MISPQNTSYGSSNIIHIRGGLEGAKNYPVTPGYTAWLLDEELKMFFIKTTNSNIPVVRSFKYEEEVPEQASQEEPSKYVTKEEFESLKQEIRKLSEKRNYYKHNNYRRNGNGKSYGKSI